MLPQLTPHVFMGNVSVKCGFLHLKVATVCKVICTCCVLHNIVLQDGLEALDAPEADDVNQDGVGQDLEEIGHGNENGNA